jgi:hypothetical protein
VKSANRLTAAQRDRAIGRPFAVLSIADTLELQLFFTKA